MGINESAKWLFAFYVSSIVSALKDPTRYFLQQLDHYDPLVSEVWHQRYFIRDEFFDGSASSPVFLCVGGEGPALDPSVVYEDDKNVHCSLMVRLARERKALILSLEHRFYGKSNPKDDLSNKNLKYLSSEQAQMDLAYFHDHISTRYGLTDSNKWITFGGSYPGMMASFARVKFPHLIFGSVISSAPVQAILDFKDFYTVVKESMQNTYIGGSQQFASLVQTGFKQLGEMLIEDPHRVKTIFDLCKGTDIEDPNIQMLFVQNLINMFPVQSNDPHCSQQLCNYEKLKNYFLDSIFDPVDTLAVIFQVKYVSLYLEGCVHFNWENYVSSMLNEDLSNLDRVWIYQTCTEWGFYQTCSEQECIFYTNSNVNSLDQFLAQCELFYELPKEKSFYESMVKRANIIYGGENIAKEGHTVTNLLYVNGEADPWHASSILSSENLNIKVINVKGASHHFWTHNEKVSDDNYIKIARQQIIDIVDSWLEEPKEMNLRLQQH